MKAILIDDEPHARQALSLLLEEYCPEVALLEQAANLVEGVKAIHRHKPELVFLDIEMPGHSGLEILDFFGSGGLDFAIVFTTAYDQYAVRAFKLSATDYLLKPIDPDELAEAVRKARLRGAGRPQVEALRANLSAPGSPTIALPVASGFEFVQSERILSIKAEGSYAQVLLQGGAKVLVSRNLKSFELLLADLPSFVRVHKSYIVNLAHVQSYQRSDGGTLLLTDGSWVPVAADRVPSLLEMVRTLKR